VALLGTFTKPAEGDYGGVAPSEAMKTALVDVLAWQCGRNDIDPEASSDFLRIDEAWNRGLPNIPGHRDCVPTLCPGGHVYELLPLIRRAVAARLDRRAPSLALVAPSLHETDLSAAERLRFSWESSEANVYLYLLEGWRRRSPDGEAIEYLSGFDASGKPAWLPTEETSASFGQLWSFFRNRDSITPGRYTFQVISRDARGRLSYKREHTVLVKDSTAGRPGITV
jgi:hypothetical protein